MTTKLTESEVEEIALVYLTEIGYKYIHCSMVSPDVERLWLVHS